MVSTGASQMNVLRCGKGPSAGRAFPPQQTWVHCSPLSNLGAWDGVGGIGSCYGVNQTWARVTRDGGKHEWKQRKVTKEEIRRVRKSFMASSLGEITNWKFLEKKLDWDCCTSSQWTVEDSEVLGGLLHHGKMLQIHISYGIQFEEGLETLNWQTLHCWRPGSSDWRLEAKLYSVQEPHPWGHLVG